MSTKIDLFIDKLYRYDRKNEHCFIGFPYRFNKIELNHIAVTFHCLVFLPFAVDRVSRIKREVSLLSLLDWLPWESISSAFP